MIAPLADGIVGRRGRWLLAALAAALSAAPLVADRYLLSVLTLTLYFAYVGQAWNVMMGFAGQLSLGHALYIGLGAYASALLWVYLGIGPWLGLFAAIALATAFGAAIGWLGFRFRVEGVHFALLTIAANEFTRIAFEHLGFAGGSGGFFIPYDAARLGQWWNLRGDQLLFYYVALMLATAGIMLTARLASSRIGYQWLAVREDELAARAVGIDVFRAKMTAVLVSSAMTAMGGVFYAFYYNNLFPAQIFDTGHSIELILAPIVGGLGTIFGPVVGAFILTPLGEGLTALTARFGIDMPGVKAVFYGLTLVAIVSARPSGVWPWLARLIGVAKTEQGSPQ
jgi:branched-chain amino acid transport system permease protein